MNRIALAVLVLVFGITTGVEAQGKKREGDSAPVAKKAPPIAQTPHWVRDASGQWVIALGAAR